MGEQWLEWGQSQVLIPPAPRGIIHFLGGAFAGALPQWSYRQLLEGLAQRGYIIVTQSVIPNLDHRGLAAQAYRQFQEVMQGLTLPSNLPVYGLGHSLGCKLHLLIGCLFPVERAGHILMSYNNFGLQRALPWLENLRHVPVLDQLPVEFSPSPKETLDFIQRRYRVAKNVLIRFSHDRLDETPQLVEILQQKFPEGLRVHYLPGNHSTPLGLEVNWEPARAFSPLDALGQWCKEWVYRDLLTLERVIAGSLA
ncbi:MAG: DUF1350 family protein [Gloeomargarita sp. SKYBB_i_bin120]|nr:DUF1350 family protein [Gloeomargarita sp. SKYB120]MDW8177695.1 DUF1350 family protein [Gloeomargarita sp. SKYBB_i_bin120]